MSLLSSNEENPVGGREAYRLAIEQGADFVEPDMAGEATLFLKVGVDGYFTDNPAIGVAARDAFRR